jgi:hypothetical protein
MKTDLNKGGTYLMSNTASALRVMLSSILKQKLGRILSKTLLSKLASHNVIDSAFPPSQTFGQTL